MAVTALANSRCLLAGVKRKKNHMDRMLATSVGIALCIALMMSVPVVADEVDAVRAVKMDPEKLAGIAYKTNNHRFALRPAALERCCAHFAS